MIHIISIIISKLAQEQMRNVKVDNLEKAFLRLWDSREPQWEPSFKEKTWNSDTPFQEWQAYQKYPKSINSFKRTQNNI